MAEQERDDDGTIALATEAAPAPAPERDAWAEMERELFEQPIVRRPPPKKPVVPRIQLPRVRFTWKHGAIALGVIVLALAAQWIWRASRPEPRSVQLTQATAEDFVRAAALSPDGQRVAWVQGSELYVRGLTASSARKIALPEGMLVEDLVWIGDEDKLIAAARLNDGFNASLWRISLDGSEPRKLRDGAHSPAMTPDGRRLAFVSQDAVGKSLWTMATSGADPKPIFKGEEHDYEQPAWSPNGQRIAFIRRSHDLINVQLMTATADGGQPVEIVTEFQPSTGPAWLDDATLVFGRSDELSASLWQVTLDEEWLPEDDPIELTRRDDVSYLDAVSAGADGRSLSFLAVRTRVDAFVADLAEGELSEPHRLTDGRADHWPVTWTPEGDAVLLNVERERRSQIMLQPAAGGEASPMGEGRVWAVTGGGDLLFGASDTLTTRLMRLAKDGSPMLLGELPAHAIHSRSVLRCPDERRGACVLGLEERDVLVLHAFDPRKASGRGPVLAKVGLGGREFGWNISPDGSRIALVNGGRTIKLVDLDDGGIRKLSLRPSVYTKNVAWAPDGRSLYVTGMILHSEGGYVLYRVDLRGREQELWRTADRWFDEPVPSPDGRRLAFAARTTEADLWHWSR